MNETQTVGRKVNPVTMLNGRASFAHLDGIAIVITDVAKWSDEDVMQMVKKQAELVGHVSAKGNITHFFGDIFGATHRKMIVEWIESSGFKPSSRTALVTDSKVMRAALTAYAWLTKTESRAFEPGDHKSLCEWIVKGTQANAAEVQAALEGCYKLLGK